MDFSCAVAARADAKCCATGARAAAAASGCSRGWQALRAGRRAPAEAEGPIRRIAAARSAAQRGRLHLLYGAARKRWGAARHAGFAQARGAGSGAQPDQALHPRSISPRTSGTRRSRRAGAAALWDQAFVTDDFSIARAVRRPKSMIVHALRAGVRAYQWVVRPLLPPACRFHPSCSDYADEALERHGAWRGGWLTARRLCRCGPWSPGGHDPVPDRFGR